MARSDRSPTAEEIADYLAQVPVGLVAEAWSLLVERVKGTSPNRRPERMLRPDDITDQYGLDRRWVYSRAAELGAIKVGRRTMLVPESNLLKYLDDHRVGNGSG